MGQRSQKEQFATEAEAQERAEKVKPHVVYSAAFWAAVRGRMRQ
jgi:hypothetical protein